MLDAGRYRHRLGQVDAAKYDPGIDGGRSQDQIDPIAGARTGTGCPNRGPERLLTFHRDVPLRRRVGGLVLGANRSDRYRNPATSYGMSKKMTSR
jgi:hypothetical protein